MRGFSFKSSTSERDYFTGIFVGVCCLSGANKELTDHLTHFLTPCQYHDEKEEANLRNIAGSQHHTHVVYPALWGAGFRKERLLRGFFVMDMIVNWLSDGQYALRQAIVCATQEAEQLDDAWKRVLERLRQLSHVVLI